MYAIVDYKGTQFRVEKDAVVRVPYLAEFEIGTEIEIPNILLIHDASDAIKIGQPTVENAKVVAEVVNHLRDKKVIVFKKKRRKGYMKKNGHRQNYSEIRVKEIINQ